MIAFGVWMGGCASSMATPPMDMKAPDYVNHPGSTKEQKCHAHEGSMFGRGQNPIFSDRKAMHLNDTVTVVINENATQSSTANKKISDLSQKNLGGGVFAGGALRNFNGMTDVSLKTNSNSSFSGTGARSRNEKFKTTITARVVKILENGNYFIYGSREIFINGAKQIIKVSGVVRSYDIDQYNTINSKYIADAKIYYQNQGDMNEATEQPWGSKLLGTIWPF